MSMSTQVRNIILQGPPDKDVPLWQASLSVSHKGAGTRSYPDRTFGVRVLAQETDTVQLPEQRSFGSTQTPEMSFHTPRLARLLVTSGDREHHYVELLGQQAPIPQLGSKEAPRFAEVTASPLVDGVDWPHARKGKLAPELPWFRLNDNRVRVHVLPCSWYTFHKPSGKGRLFGSMPAPVSPDQRLCVDLLADAVEFSAEPPNPLFGFGAYQDEPGKTLTGARLSFKRLPDGRLALELIGFDEPQQASNARAAFAALADTLTGRLASGAVAPTPLLLRPDTTRAVPPLRWMVNYNAGSGRFSIDDLGVVDIDPLAIAPGLDFHAGGAPGAAAFLAASVTLVNRGQGAQLLIKAGEGVPADAVRLDVDWTMNATTTQLLPPKGNALRFSVDRLGIQRQLGDRYRAAGALGQDDGPAPYMYLPLRDGALQLALPVHHPDDLRPPSPAELSTDILSGTLLLRDASGGSALRIETLRGLDIAVRWSGLPRVVEGMHIGGGGPGGTLSGVLWALDASPSAEEMLPTLRAGPVATRDLLLRFGGADDKLLEISSERWSSKDALQLRLRLPHEPARPTILWRGHDSLPLMALANMLCSLPSSRRASVLNGWFPHRAIHQAAGAAVREQVDLVCPGPASSNPYAEFRNKWPLWTSVDQGWPFSMAVPDSEQSACAQWPDAPSVDLVLPTAPDLMMTPIPAKDGTSSMDRLAVVLRFDVAALDRYFAAVSLPEPQPAATAGPAPLPLTSLQALRMPAFWRRQAQQNALARTASAFVTAWTDAGDAKGAVSAVSGLCVPHVWQAKFAFRPSAGPLAPPLGEYSLDGADMSLDFKSGADAIAGLTKKDKIDGKMQVKAFAVAAVLADGKIRDSLGGWIAAEAWTAWDGSIALGLRAAGVNGGAAVQLATLAKVLKVRGPDGAVFGFSCTDLPMHEQAGNRLVFSGFKRAGTQDDVPWDRLESAATADAAGFDPATQSSAAMRWRFFEEPSGAPLEFDVGMGPLRFKPLRLARLEISRTPGQDPVARLEVLGRMRVARLAQAAGAFGTDGGDEGGNLVMLVMTPEPGQGLQLRHLRRVRVADPAPLTIEDSSAPLRFELNEKEHLFAPVFAGASAAAWPSLELTLDPTHDLATGFAKLIAAAAIRLPGLGLADHALGGASISVPAGKPKALRFEWQSEPRAGEGLHLTGLFVEWPAVYQGTDFGWTMQLRTAAPADTGLERAPLTLTIDYRNDANGKQMEIGGAWLGAKMNKTLTDAQPFNQSVLLDAGQSCLQLATGCDMAQSELVRGLNLAGRPESADVMALAILGAAVVSPPAGGLVAWPLQALRCDVQSAWTAKAGETEEQYAFRHRLSKSKNRWTSRLEVTGVLSTVSGIDWPGGVTGAGLPGQVQDPADQAGFAGNIDGGSRKIRIGAQEPKRHTVALRLIRHLLPLDRLEYVGNVVRIARPWSTLATVSHVVSVGQGGQQRSMSWRSLDDVTIIDQQALAERCAQESVALQDIAGKPEYSSGISPAADRRVAYAFGARFRSDIVADPGAPAHGMVQAGIGVRGYVSAGFPAWRIAGMLAPLKETAAGLLITGGGVTRFDLIDAEAGTQASAGQPWRDSSLTLAMPWLASTGAGFGQLRFSQSGGGVEWEAADADLVPAVPESATLTGASLTLRPNDSEAEIHAALQPILAPGAAQGGEWRRAALTSVEQVFLREADTTQPQQSAQVTPFWLRSMVALDALWTLSAPDRLLLRPRGLVPSATSAGRIALIEVGSARRAKPAAIQTLAVVMASGGEIQDLRAGQPQGRLAAVAMNAAYQSSNQPQAVMAATTSATGEAPFCSAWEIVEVGRVDDFGAPAQALRRFDDLVYASSALDWPTPDAVAELAGMALAGGEEYIVQQKSVGMSGQLQSYGIAARAPEALQARYWSFAERPMFERPRFNGPSIASLPAPSALHLAPAPARQRSPSYAQTRAKLKGMAALSIDAVAPIMPPEMAQLTIGLRPGVIYQRRAAGVMPLSDKRVMDAQESKYGTAAASGPAMVQQGRSPRSTLLPESASPARRRRTIVAWDRGMGDVPTAFLWLQGSAGVVRTGLAAEPASSGVLPEGEVSYLVEVDSPAYGQLDSAWDHKITLRISSPTGADPAAFFTEEGTQAPLLIIGPVAVTLSRGRATAGPKGTALLSYELQSKDAEAVADALVAADGDTRALVVLRYLSAKDSAKPLAEAETWPLPPLCLPLELALTIKPEGRPTAAAGQATLVFSDPSYDRILHSNTQSDSRREKGGEFWLLAADRQVYDRNASVVFAFGPLAAKGGAFEEELLKHLGISTVTYDLTLKWLPAAGSGAGRGARDVYASPQAAAPKTRTVGALTTIYSIALATLVDENGARCVLEPGDLLSLNVKYPSNAKVGNKLVVERSIMLRIVAEDVIPPAPSIFALVRVATTDKQSRADVPLFACAPLPQTVSYPSIMRDLAQGLVRRRAHFQWHHPQLIDKDSRLEATLVKIDRTGGAQLPASKDLRALNDAR